MVRFAFGGQKRSCIAFFSRICSLMSFSCAFRPLIMRVLIERCVSVSAIWLWYLVALAPILWLHLCCGSAFLQGSIPFRPWLSFKYLLLRCFSVYWFLQVVFLSLKVLFSVSIVMNNLLDRVKWVGIVVFQNTELIVTCSPGVRDLVEQSAVVQRDLLLYVVAASLL